jgi:hypothetical protein
MNELLEKLLEVVELGKADQKSPFPPNSKVRMEPLNLRLPPWKQVSVHRTFSKKH